MALPVDGNLDFQSTNKAINLPTPTNSGDAAPKSYVDSMAAGIIYLQAVRAASVGSNISITAPGAALDGVTLAAGDRILLKDQTTASQNGVWVWNGAAVAATRPTDFASAGTAKPGTSAYVEQGTVNANALFAIVATANITIDTTSQTWTQVNGLGDISVTAPITKSGNTIGLNSGSPLPILNGGTGSSTAAGARTALGAVTKFASTIGDGSTTSFSVNHGLGTTDVIVQVYDMATGNLELVQTVIVDANHVTIGPFGSAPAAASGSMPAGTGKRVVVTA